MEVLLALLVFGIAATAFAVALHQTADLAMFAQNKVRITRILESALAEQMPGYVEHKAFTAADGERVTLVTFADRASHDAWRDHPEHRQAQRAGVRDYYEEYSISVGVVDRARAWTRERRDEDAGGSSVLLPPGR